MSSTTTTTPSTADDRLRVMEARVRYLESGLEQIRSVLATAAGEPDADLMAAVSAAVDALACEGCRERRRRRR